MLRRHWLTTAAALPFTAAPSLSAREEWVIHLRRIINPVLHAAAHDQLKRNMPVEAAPGVTDRRQYTYLVAVGRALCGAAPYLALAEAQDLRSLATEALDRTTDPRSPDYLNFATGQQPLVDAAFLALALLRAPNVLWEPLPKSAQARLLAALRSSREIKPPFNNWLLFSATVEAFFASVGESWDKMRVDYALKALDSWYKGDGLYGDGPSLHVDYYNSFVIHPLLLIVSEATGQSRPEWMDRSARYAGILERLVAPDGSYPAVGRSLAYRCGAFHLLADLAWRQKLPESLPPAQVRHALTAVIRKTMSAPGTYDTAGWLQIGLCGHQPSLGERYISTGSLYLCTTAFLPLGLPAANPFWSSSDAPTTAEKVWNNTGAPPIDHAL